MNNFFYSLLIRSLDPILWRGKLYGEENLPKKGPAVFVANHLDALGPIGVTCSIPLRLNAWVIADVVDKDLAPAYMQADFVERQLHFKPPLSRWFSQALSRISVPFLNSIGGIPVYCNDYVGMRKTLRISLEVLCERKFILVFPEDPDLPADPQTRMNPFMYSFARLGELYYTDTGECLDFYPVAVHPKRYVVVGKPVPFNPVNPANLERRRLKNSMKEFIEAIILQPDPGVLARISP